MKLTHARAVALMVLVTLMWSIAGVVTRQLEQARSFELTFWRSFFTVISLALILPLAQGRQAFTAVRHGGAALWLSGLCWGVMFTAFMVALTLTRVANVLVTMALGPLVAAILARVFLQYRVPTRTWMAIAVAGAGIVYMHASELSSGHALGTFVALAVPLASALNWILNQHYHARGQGVGLVPAVLVGAALSALASWPLALPLQATPHDLGLLALLGLVQLAIPCTLAVVSARALSAPEVTLIGLLEVVFGILWAWIGAGEQPSSGVLAGGTLVIGALVANEWVTWRGR